MKNTRASFTIGNIVSFSPSVTFQECDLTELWFYPRLDDCILAGPVLEHSDDSVVCKIADWFLCLSMVQVLLVQGET